MPLSPEAIAVIRSHVADWTPGDAEILAAANTPTIDNPTPQGTVLPPLAESAVLTLLSLDSRKRLNNFVNLGEVKRDFRDSNRGGLVIWALYVLPITPYIPAQLDSDPIITEAEGNAIVAYLLTPIPDPAYRPQLSWPEVHIGRALTLDDIAASRPGA